METDPVNIYKQSDHPHKCDCNRRSWVGRVNGNDSSARHQIFVSQGECNRKSYFK